jgi:hypothetical protein
MNQSYNKNSYEPLYLKYVIKDIPSLNKFERELRDMTSNIAISLMEWFNEGLMNLEYYCYTNNHLSIFRFLNSRDINSLTRGQDNHDCFSSVESLFSLLIRDIRMDLSKGKMIGFFTSGDKYLLISGENVRHEKTFRSLLS